MPSQTDVQQLIQGLTPGAVNNGNPNTVYNTAATPMQPPQSRNPAWAAGMAPIPQTTAYGEWMLPGSWQAPAPPQQLNLPVWRLPPLQAGGGGTGSTPPGGTGTTGSTPGGVGSPNPGEIGSNDNTGVTYDGTTANVWEKFQNDMGDSMGQPGSEQWNRNQEWFNSNMSNLYGMKNEDGSWDWRQLLDMVTEPLIGGNFWLSGSEKWDASNAIAGVLESFTGIPFGNIMNQLGEWQATQDDPIDNPIERMLADHWEDNANNQVATFENILTNYLGNWTANQTQQYNQQFNNQSQNWTNIYTSAYVDNVLAGMSPEQAREQARNTATQTADSTPQPGSDNAGSTDGGGRQGRMDNLGYGVTAQDGSCVVVDSVLVTHRRAGDVKVDDTMQAINAMDFETDDTTVSYSEAKLQPCVRITTNSGVVLECSRSAPIADDTGDQVLAENLLGYSVPVCVNGMIDFDTVVSVEDIGEQMVQHITCGDNFFLAGKEKNKYLLHHNTKYFDGAGNRTTASGWGGSGSITNWAGLKWGW